MPENRSPRGEEYSCVILGVDGILDVNVAALPLRLRAERMLLLLGDGKAQLGEKASTKTMLVLQMDIAAMMLSVTPSAMYSDAICSGDRAMVALAWMLYRFNK